jgi:5-methylthioadenosine/S-adenosylhomocysteine deaminase
VSSILIRDGWIVTPKGEGVQVIQEGAVAIEGSKIVAVGRSEDMGSKGSYEITIDASKKAILPGFIDAHIHTSLSLVRGLAQDVAESEWMHRTVGPFTRHYDRDTALVGSKLCVLEAIKSGTTCFCDYGAFMSHLGREVFAKSGVRADICTTINEMGTGPRRAGELYEFDADIGEEKIKSNLELIQTLHGTADGRITCHFGPQAADMMSKELLLRVKELAQEYNVPIHMHIAQGGRERAQMTKRYGMSTVQFLRKIDYLSQNLIAVHCHDSTEEEIQTLVQNGVRMVGCPGSIGLIDGVVPPLQDFISAGGTAALGSDQCPPDGHNMFSQMKYAAILNKVKHQDPTVLPSWKVFRLATIEAAKCHGLGDKVGSLEVGKKADVILLNLDSPHLTPRLGRPIRNIVPNIVHLATGSEVSTVIVDGHIIMDDSQVRTMDEKRVVSDAQDTAEELARRAEADVIEADSGLVRMMREGRL